MNWRAIDPPRCAGGRHSQGANRPSAARAVIAVGEFGQEAAAVAGPGQRLADEHVAEERHEQRLAPRQCLAQAVQADRVEGHRRMPLREVRDARLERGRRLRLAAAALREQDHDRAVGERVVDRRQRMPAAAAAGPVERHDPQDVQAEPLQAPVPAEVVLRRDRPQGRQPPQREQAHQGERVEVAVVVRDDAGGPRLRQPLPMPHVHPQHDQRHRPHHAREEQEAERAVHGKGVVSGEC